MQSEQVGFNLFKAGGEVVLHIVSQISYRCLSLHRQLLKAFVDVLFKGREAVSHRRKDSGRFVSCLLRIRQMEIDLTLAGHQHQLLFRQVLLTGIGKVNLLRGVNPILLNPLPKGFGVGMQQVYAPGKIESATHYYSSFC